MGALSRFVSHFECIRNMSVFQIARAARIVPQSIRPVAASYRMFSAPALRNQIEQKQTLPVGLGAPLTKRNAGVSVLGCGIAVVAIGGCAQGIGQLFGCLVVGMARNPSMREDLFTYTLIGMGFLELLAIVVLLFAGMLLYSE